MEWTQNWRNCPHFPRKAFTRIIEKQGLKITTEAKVLGVAKEEKGLKVSYQVKDEKKEAIADKVLVAVGRAPCTDGLNLKVTAAC